MVGGDLARFSVERGAGAQPWGHAHRKQLLNKKASLSRGRAQAAARSEAKGPGEHGGEALALDSDAFLWNGQPGTNEATSSAKAGAVFKRRKHAVWICPRQHN